MTNKKRKGNLFSLIFISLFLTFSLTLVSASVTDLGYFSPNTCVQIVQTSSSATSNNISSIIISNGGNTPTLANFNPNLVMTSPDNFTYNYSFCNTSSLGTYFVNGVGNDGGTIGNWNYQFEIGLPLWIIVIVMIIGYGIAILGLFKYRNKWVSMCGGMIMVILGLYLTGNGIGIYNNLMTLVVGYITIILGCVALIVPIGESLEGDLNIFG